MTRSRIVPGDGDPRHGTGNGYTNLGCRCDDCTTVHTAAWLEYMRTSELQQRKRLERAAAREERRLERLQPCGTTGAYRRHYLAFEEPCELCRQAQRDYDAGRRERDREKRRERDREYHRRRKRSATPG